MQYKELRRRSFLGIPQPSAMFVLFGPSDFLFKAVIADDLYIGAGNQAPLYHPVQMRNQCSNLVFSVDDAHHNGRVLGEGETSGMIDPGAGPIAFETTIDNRACESKLLALCDDRLVQWLALPLIRLR